MSKHFDSNSLLSAGAQRTASTADFHLCGPCAYCQYVGWLPFCDVRVRLQINVSNVHVCTRHINSAPGHDVDTCTDWIAWLGTGCVVGQQCYNSVFNAAAQLVILGQKRSATRIRQSFTGWRYRRESSFDYVFCLRGTMPCVWRLISSHIVSSPDSYITIGINCDWLPPLLTVKRPARCRNY